MNQSSVEKNGWSAHSTTRSRPVNARASLTAAVVTSEPFFANLTMSAAGSEVEQALGQVDLEGSGPHEVGAFGRGLDHRLDDRG